MPMSASFWCAFAGRPARIVLGFVLVLLAAACGGGGGGGGSIGGGSTGGGSSFNTAEFQANFGLGNINVLSAYDAGFSGQGQTVAVIDTGIDVDHPDLDANIAAASTDIVTGNPIFVDDDDGHGTSVAGVIAAERNGIGMHGVAFNSEILAIRTDTIGSCFTICAFEDDDIAAAVDFAVANGAGVINISLGGAVPSNATLRTALQNATAAGVIVVVAAGNDGGANPISPALLAADATFNGLIIAAGAVDSTNAIASFSNLAGTTQNFYLVAPGVNIFTTTIGGGFTTVSGTSFSAPHIAGGFALILERFPALTAAQVVQLLLDTATDLGAAGTDAVFGQGLLNLSAALAPLGTLSVPLGTTTGSGASGLGSTTMSLGSAFGDALTDAPVLAKAIVLDELGRAYLADLALGVGPADETLDLASLLVTEGEINSGTIDISTGSRLRLAFVERPAAIPGNAADGPDAAAAFTKIDDLEFDFSAALSDQTRLSLGFGKPLFDLGTLDWMGRPAYFIAKGASPSPHWAMASGGEYLALRHRLSDRAKFTFGLSGTAREFDAYGQRDRHAAFVEFGRGIAGADIALRLGSLMEEGSLLDSVTGGAYESFDSAQTTFFTAAARLPIGEHSALTGHLSHGFTEVDETGRGLLGSFSTIRTLSFGTAAISHALFRDDDIVALSLSHPLRITGGTVTLNVPTGIDYLSGAIERTAERASLVPQGREIDIELSYGFSPLAGFDVQANLLYRREPGHVRSAPDDATLLVLLKRTF